MPEHRSKMLFDLPLEIREQIYRYLFRGLVVSPASYVRAQTSKPTRTSIFRACHACYDEARPVFVQTACFSLGDPSSGYKPEIQDETMRMVGAFQLHLIHHLRVPLPYTYESWSNDLTVPYKNLKTLTIAVGLSHLGAVSLPSEPRSAEHMKEMIKDGEQSHRAKEFSVATFENDLVVLMWTPPECFIYNFIQRRDETRGNYKIYVQTRPDILSELELNDLSYRQELSYLRLCSFEGIEPGLAD
jgi:hypothetical protein